MNRWLATEVARLRAWVAASDVPPDMVDEVTSNLISDIGMEEAANSAALARAIRRSS